MMPMDIGWTMRSSIGRLMDRSISKLMDRSIRVVFWCDSMYRFFGRGMRIMNIIGWSMWFHIFRSFMSRSMVARWLIAWSNIFWLMGFFIGWRCFISRLVGLLIFWCSITRLMGFLIC